MLAYCQSVCLPSFLSTLSVPIPAFLPICLSAFHSVSPFSVFLLACIPCLSQTSPFYPSVCLTCCPPVCLSILCLPSGLGSGRVDMMEGIQKRTYIQKGSQTDRWTERRGYARPELPGCCESCDQGAVNRVTRIVNTCIIFREVITSSLTKFVCCAILIERWMRLDMLSSTPYPSAFSGLLRI